MSTEARIALLDDRTVASNPGGITVNRFRFARHFPLWPVVLLLALLASISACTVWRPGIIAVLVTALANIMFWTRVRLRFQRGCINPAIVLSEQPFILGVHTDLSIGQNPYSVIKVLAHPPPRGRQFRTGQRCATVALYTGAANAEHWENFEPMLVECATLDQSEIQRLMNSIEKEEWAALEAGVRQLPQPIKRGLYPIQPRSGC